jgi:hypothetical protein
MIVPLTLIWPVLWSVALWLNIAVQAGRGDYRRKEKNKLVAASTEIVSLFTKPFRDATTSDIRRRAFTGLTAMRRRTRVVGHTLCACRSSALVGRLENKCIPRRCCGSARILLFE